MAFVGDRYLAIISGETRGLPAEVARGVLWLLSLAYRGIIALRNGHYNAWRRAAKQAGCPVVSIGNITVGGTGKTPVAAHVANLLVQRGRRTAILLRGYKGGLIQFDEEQVAQAVGRSRRESDEALVLKRRCPRAMVIADPDRVAAARRAVSRGVQAIVLDDGFQHRRLARGLDIVLVDATSPFGYGRLLPRGLLREPMGNLRRADLIVLTRSNQVHETERDVLVHRLGRISRGRPVICAAHRLGGFVDVKGRELVVEDPTAVQAILFAGIGNFEGFRRSVEELGVRVAAAYRYPDHHDYGAEEIEGLLDVAATLEANALITTEKDAVKLVGRWPDEGCRLLVTRLDIEFDAEGDRILAAALDGVLRS
jgi:tetraacyldisaccharide 4'-kinase